MNYAQLALQEHVKHRGKLEVRSKVSLQSKDDLSTYYSPGVAEPCLKIFEDKESAFSLTWKANTIAVVSDGSAVLGLGNIGGLAGLPVMEGKAILFKEFGGVDAVPIVLSTQDPEEIIRVVEAIAPSFGGINLEDIAAPNCFYIEAELKKRLNIPVFHDDQHGTAIVVLAGLMNALKLRKGALNQQKIVVSGAGAAAVAIGKLLHQAGAEHIIFSDSKGLLSSSRSDLDSFKQELLPLNVGEFEDFDIMI